ncbi:MAG: dihydroorotate dehydrogenase [Actinobacteria bacterium]|nr:dihydroorotate dehydrogenase [Actinomycetota bacterium]
MTRPSLDLAGSRRLSCGPRALEQVDLTAHVGSVTLRAPVMTASGTSGHGAELARYLDLSALGAVVVKSLAAQPWPGNPAPRIAPGPGGAILNSVGLQGPGVEAWLETDLPDLLQTGAHVVASIWGRTVGEFEQAACLLRDAPSAVVAVEVNVSCPNVEDRRRMFSHSPKATAEAVEASAACARPLWAKLSPNVADIAEIAAAALGAGAEAITLINTVLGMEIDVESKTPRLGGLTGGISGPPIRPVAVRAVWDCRTSFPDAAIVGVGGVARGVDAVEMMMAGADAVQVGTASFADPKAAARVVVELRRWCAAHGIYRTCDLRGAAHGCAGG